jgi:hypothetical protein
MVEAVEAVEAVATTASHGDGSTITKMDDDKMHLCVFGKCLR